MPGSWRVHTRGGVGERTSLGAGAGEVQCVGAGGGGRIRCLCGARGAKKDCALMERHDAAMEERGPGKGPRGGGVEPAAGQGVGLGVEGGEEAGGAGVVLPGEPGLVHAEGGGEEGHPVRDGEGGGGGRAAGEVAELGGGGVRGEEGLAGPATEGEHGGYFGDPLCVGGVAGEGVEAKPAAVEGAVVGVPEEEAGAEAAVLLAPVARDHDIGEGVEGGQGPVVVLLGGAYMRGGEEVAGDVKGGECLSQGGTFGEPGGGAAWGDEGRCGGHREGVGAPGGAEVGAEKVEGGPVC